MANEEITISELELADSVLGDMVIAVDTTSDTKSVTLSQLKAWLGSSLPTGFILPAVGKISDERFTLLDGKTLARTGTYEAFCNKVVEQVQAGNWFSCTDTEFNDDVAAYGQCGRFVITNDYVRIPLITRYIGATVTLSEVGKTYAESLPNIKGNLNTSTKQHSSNISGDYGAFTATRVSNTTRYRSDGSSDNPFVLGFNASLYSSTYQDNAKVNPEHTKFPYYMVIATNGQQEEIDVDINEVYEDLELKANKNLSNIANVADTTKSLFAGYAMPSDTYDDLTLGASGSNYTAPANGWFTIDKATTGAQYLALINTNNKIKTEGGATNSGQTLRLFLPVKKNDVVECLYSAAGTLNCFRFVYAVGSESEASNV